MKRLIYVFIAGLICSCSYLDVKEHYYQGYQDAIDNEFIGNGYMPTDFMKPSIFEIRTKLNMDINESLIKVQFSNKADFDSIKNYGTVCNIKFVEPRTFKVPKWWDYNVDSCLTLCYQDIYGLNYCFGLDTNKLMIYGWNDSD